MIGYLSGILQSVSKMNMLINVNGVGYSVMASASMMKKFLTVGESIEAYIHTHVREDALSLYGFTSTPELELFELLLSVSGVGPKVALSVLSSGTPDEVKAAVAQADVDYFIRPGVGKKTAQRIIVDLKAKVGDLREIDLSEEVIGGQKDLVDALRTMGFSPAELKAAIKDIDRSLSLDQQIRQALKHL